MQEPTVSGVTFWLLCSSGFTECVWIVQMRNRFHRFLWSGESPRLVTKCIATNGTRTLRSGLLASLRTEQEAISLLFLRSLLVTTSKALVTTRDALVTTNGTRRNVPLDFVVRSLGPDPLSRGNLCFRLRTADGGSVM